MVQPIKLQRMKAMRNAWTPKQPVWFQKNDDNRATATKDMTDKDFERNRKSHEDQRKHRRSEHEEFEGR